MQIGCTYNRLTVVGGIEKINNQKHIKCKCTCGNELIVKISNLTSSHTKSCGCLQKEWATKKCYKHGGSYKREYGIWKGMRRRCNSSNNPAYKYYGARGISVCKEWNESFEKFYNDMGKSNGMTLDRIDNNGNYEPCNCRWVERKTQMRNMRRNYLITFNDKTMPLCEWAEVIGVTYSALRHRINRGWALDRALQTPMQR